MPLHIQVAEAIFTEKKKSNNLNKFRMWIDFKCGIIKGQKKKLCAKQKQKNIDIVARVKAQNVIGSFVHTYYQSTNSIDHLKYTIFRWCKGFCLFIREIICNYYFQCLKTNVENKRQTLLWLYFYNLTIRFVFHHFWFFFFFFV